MPLSSAAEGPEGSSLSDEQEAFRYSALLSFSRRKHEPDKEEHRSERDADHDQDGDKDDHHDHDHHKDQDKDDDDDDNGGKQGGTGGCRGPTATPFLLIPASAADTGARPIPASQAVMNDSIQATIANPPAPSPAPAYGWDQFQIQLSCVVGNLGAVASVVGLAAFYIGDQFGIWNNVHESLTPAQVKANAKLVGYAPFMVPAGGTTTVVCPKFWVPGSSTAAQKGVLVQVYDLFTDKMTTPFDAVNDRHVARNDEVMDPIIE